jgi:thiol:disulfide interchange protein DsbD
VLIDFTADWCLTCQLFSKTAIENEAVQKRLKELNAGVFIGDFTDQDPLIAAEILRHGRAGVPLVLVYPGDLTSPAILLPETLTPSALLKALETLGK